MLQYYLEVDLQVIMMKIMFAETQFETESFIILVARYLFVSATPLASIASTTFQVFLHEGHLRVSFAKIQDHLLPCNERPCTKTCELFVTHDHLRLHAHGLKKENDNFVVKRFQKTSLLLVPVAV